MEAKKIEEEIRKKGGDTVKPTSVQQAGEEQSGTPTFETPLQPEVQTRERALKRVGAMADISACSRSQQSAKRSQPNNDNDPIR